MTDDRSIERAARSWLEIGPTEAPERAIEAALLKIGMTSQERDWRVSWRLPALDPVARTLIGVATAAVLLVGGVLLFSATTGPMAGIPTAAPSTSPSATARFSLSRTFMSPLMGYSIKIADGWTVTAATIAWDGTTNNEPPAADVITVTGTDSTVTVASQLVPADTTYAKWLDQFHNDTIPGVPQGCDGGDPTTWRHVQIGSETGVVQSLCNAEIAFVDVDGRIYSFWLGSSTFNTDQHVTEAEFGGLLRTVTFDAGSAVDAVPLTKTFTSPWYRYSIGYGAGWMTTPASKHWAGFDNTDPFVDDLKPTDTDSTISIASQALPAGTSFDAWVAAYHAKVMSDVPSGCDGGDPSTWPTTAIGPETGHYYLMCNAAEAIAEVGGRVYLFALGNATFDGSQHFVVSHFLQMLTTVSFDGGAAVTPSVAP